MAKKPTQTPPVSSPTISTDVPFTPDTWLDGQSREELMKPSRQRNLTPSQRQRSAQSLRRLRAYNSGKTLDGCTWKLLDSLPARP